MTKDMGRYARQLVLPQVGEEGQQKLLASSVTVIGCGALGTHIADSLARAGVGRLRLVDRDVVELHNLQRQILFNEDDVRRNMPKAVAAAEKLKLINSSIEIEPVVADVHPGNIEEMVDGVDLVLDGTDNFETRMLVNDVCLKNNLPWVYGGAIGTSGMSMNIIPGETPCFRCLMRSLPAPGSTPTCETAGILAATAAIIAAVEVTEGMKLLLGRGEKVSRKLFTLDLWNGAFNMFEITKSTEPCPACDLGRYEFLAQQAGSRAASLCPRDAVQIYTNNEHPIEIAELAKRLNPVGEVTYNDYLLRLRVDDYELDLFPDGRAIIKGTNDPSAARALYTKYIGL